MICTFIGHREVPNEIKECLKPAIIDLIEKENVNMFYVGNHGQFDFLVKTVLEELKETYNIKYHIVLAYMPLNDGRDYSNTIFLEELGNVPYRYRIIERNKWMIKKSDFVVVYFKHFGKTRDFKDYAESLGKRIIKI